MVRTRNGTSRFRDLNVRSMSDEPACGYTQFISARRMNLRRRRRWRDMKLKFIFKGRTRLVSITAGFCLAISASAAEEAPVTISVDAKNPGVAIAPDFSGLSFEVSQLLPNA